MLKFNKIFLTFFLFFLIIPTSLWYELSQEKINQLNQIKEYLNTDIENHDIEFYQSKLDAINSIIPKYKNNIKNWYFLSQIKIELENIIANNYVSIPQVEIQEESTPINTEEKSNSLNDFKLKFLNKYWNNLIWKNLDEKCIKYYDFIDNISKQNDFPTALVIATWRMEWWCNLSNPNNWWWPFQITSHYYKPWKISLDEFWVSIKNFIDFSKNKWKNYEKNPKLKEKFQDHDIEITYNYFPMIDLKIHSALYNWLKNKSSLDSSLFINWNFNSDLKSKTDWIITTFLKVLKYETKK